VTLLDADLRKPAIHRMFKLPNRQGLTDLFRNKLDLSGVINSPEEIKGLRVITSGALPPNPADLLASTRMERILGKMSEGAEVVVIDTPPAMVADAQVISSRVDCVLLVIQPGKTHIDAAIATMEQFQRTGARVVGAVLNRITRRSSRYYGKYRYHARYYYASKYYAAPVKKEEKQPTQLHFPAWLHHEENGNGSKPAEEKKVPEPEPVIENVWPNRPLAVSPQYKEPGEEDKADTEPPLG
jgi:capsular exopolysaccharide synthesis family protein